MDLAKFAIEKRLISALMTILILLAGYLSYQSLPRFEDPEFIIRQAQVITPYSGASANEVAEEVTDVIESAIQQLTGVKEVNSVSTEGLSRVTVEFTIQSAKTRELLSQKFTQLRSKISDTQNQLPPNAGPTIVFDDFGDVYAQYYAVTGDGYSLNEIHDYLKELEKQLLLVPGVSKVRLVGVPQRVVYITYKPNRLFELGLSAGQIAQVIEGQNLIVSGGSVETGGLRVSFRPDNGVSSIEDLKNIRIADARTGKSFRLKDIAQVHEAIKDPVHSYLYRDGKPAIGLGISNKIGGNVVKMGDAVNARIDALASQRPIGIELHPISEQSQTVRVSVDDFVLNVVTALAIVVGTLLIFMGLRSGILMGGILLITVAGTLFGMKLYGLDMQRVSLGALIIALGMLVDNAIVVVEGTLVRVQRGESPASASMAIVKQTTMPLLGGTVVGFLAFSPIGFSPDNTGEFAGSMFWTVAIALMLSWLVAIWLTPYYCTLLLKPGKKAAKEKQDAIASHAANAKEGDGQDREHFILRAYRSILGWSLRNRLKTISAVLLVFAGVLSSASYMEIGFFPASTRAQFVVDYYLPEGTDIGRTNSELAEIDAWIQDLEGVTHTNRVVGEGHPRFMLIYDSEDANPAYGQILVDVDDYRRIEGMLGIIRTHIEQNYVDAFTKVWQFVIGPGGGSKIEATFKGTDAEILRDLANKAKRIMADEGAVAIKDSWREMIKVVRPVINEANMRRLGLTQGDITKALASHFDGMVIGVFRDKDELLQIIFRPEGDDRRYIEQAANIQIFSSTSGHYIPMRQVVDDFEFTFENARLRREDRALTIKAQSDPAPSVNANDLLARIQPKVEAIDLPAGYELQWDGEFGNSAEANAGLAATMPIGFGAMVVVVFLLFNAIRQPLIIWLTVPLIMIGVIPGLIIMDTPLEFMGILGVLSLTGMLIKNAIVLIDQTDLEISEGKARFLAVLDASVSRVRPVMLGVLTTVLGVVPLLWDPFFKSLAVVIIFGLTFASILTLIVVPTLYALFFHIKPDEVQKPEEAKA